MKVIAHVLLVFTMFKSVHTVNCQTGVRKSELAKNLDVFLTDEPGLPL